MRRLSDLMGSCRRKFARAFVRVLSWVPGRVSTPPVSMRLRLQGGHLVPCATVEVTSSGRRAGAAPLLEEERDARGEALVADASDPIGVHGARPGSALAADDDPVQSVGAKREVAEIGEERLAGDETDVAGRGSEVGEAHEVGRGFDTDGDTETAWKVCEPTSIQHEGPSRRLVEMATRVAALRGSPIACFGSADLVRRDAARPSHRVLAMP